ncbi:MAG: hypothetical protein ROO76_17970 [Terriglobia bacterium]|jgi:hypothetical protein|nr:hypothetical protein [Terriglobia bacterium]
MERRDFLVGTAAAVTNAGKLKGEMLYRQLGKTGVEVSATGLRRRGAGRRETGTRGVKPPAA